VTGIVGTEDSFVERPDSATVIWRLLLGAHQLIRVFVRKKRTPITVMKLLCATLQV